MQLTSDGIVDGAGAVVHLSDVVSTRLASVPEESEVHKAAAQSLTAAQDMPATQQQDEPAQELHTLAQDTGGTKGDTGDAIHSPCNRLTLTLNLEPKMSYCAASCSTTLLAALIG